MKRALFLLIAAAYLPAFADEPDAPGCKDLPFVTRMPNYYITECSEKDYDEVEFYGSDGASKKLAGRRQHLNYNAQQGKATAGMRIWRNFETALKQASWKMVYSNNGTITAQKGTQWIQVVTADDYYIIDAIKEEGPEQSITASALLDELSKKGHVVVPVLFDTGKATIKPDSKPVIEQMVALMKESGALKVEIQGHTDNVGQAPANQLLSQQRADAVKAALVAGGIPSVRMTAKGYGQTKPVAPNTTEEGRAQNRRVELVKVP